MSWCSRTGCTSVEDERCASDLRSISDRCLVAYKQRQTLLLLGRPPIDLVRIVHQHMVATILVQQQNHVVLERRIREGTQQMDARLRRDVGILEDATDKGEEVVAQRPRAFALDQILVQLFDRRLLLLGQLTVDQLDERLQLGLGLKADCKERVDNVRCAERLSLPNWRLTSMSMYTTGGSRFRRRSSSALRSALSSSTARSVGSISAGITSASPLPPFNSADCTSDMLAFVFNPVPFVVLPVPFVVPFDVTLSCRFLRFSFFFSFFAILS